MRFRVLGPLLVNTGGRWLPVAAGQQRVVLAMLLSDAGRVVETERLVDAVWGSRPPRRAVNTVQAYVMRLRRLLGDGVLATQGHGYRLTVPEGAVDAGVFERSVAAGRAELARGRLDDAVARLTAASALWRGPVLADVPDAPALVAFAARLDRARLAAEEDRVGALLALDRPAEVVDELHRLVAEHPLREQLWAHLVAALHRSGRRAEALDAYRRARRVLREELGLEPGPHLRELQRAILAGDAPPVGSQVVSWAARPVGSRTRPPDVPARRPAPVPPAQLPAEVAAFIGRDRPLALLDRLLDGGGAAPAAALCAIAGAAGVGKTALAVHWAHRVRARFRDGQLYADLRGHTAGAAVPAVEALARFLRALGVPPEQVPSDLDEASALYRSRLADRRVLVLLDDARDPEQVRPLLPGNRRCLALVTSRDRLRGLVARDGAVPLGLDALTDDEAYTLLGRLLGAQRLRAEPQTTDELVRLCGNLPLALRTVAANLATGPRTSIAEYVRRLRHDRWSARELAGSGD